MGKRRVLTLRHAIALGLLHGPTELLPISSSAHTSLVPWLAGWPYGTLDPELRKSFEVALHAGTAAALLARPPWGSPSRNGDESERNAVDRDLLGRVRVEARLGFLAWALAAPAVTGYTLGSQIERKLGTPATIVAGLLAGSAMTGAAEMYVRGGCPTRERVRAPYFATHTTPTRTPPHAAHTTPTDDRLAAPISPPPAVSPGWRDGLLLGLAQSLALFPGVSRSGATLAAARARGFSRLDADRLSWRVGLPVIAGAAALKGSQLAQAGIPREVRLPLAAGAASALLSTLVSVTVLTPRRRTRLLPACAVYRGMLALLVIRRMRDNTE